MHVQTLPGDDMGQFVGNDPFDLFPGIVDQTDVIGTGVTIREMRLYLVLLTEILAITTEKNSNAKPQGFDIQKPLDLRDQEVCLAGNHLCFRWCVPLWVENLSG